MYSDLVKRLRTAAVQAQMTRNKTWWNLMQEASDAIEALERNQGCPAWDAERKVCQIMNLPVKEETDV